MLNIAGDSRRQRAGRAGRLPSKIWSSDAFIYEPGLIRSATCSTRECTGFIARQTLDARRLRALGVEIDFGGTFPERRATKRRSAKDGAPPRRVEEFQSAGNPQVDAA
jgi:hypothetical protein